MLPLDDVIPCRICGSKPILSGPEHTKRLKCPNYKSKEIKHGNLSADRNELTMGFTNWCNFFWNEVQEKTEGIPTIVKEWNTIHQNSITNQDFDQLEIQFNDNKNYLYDISEDEFICDDCSCNDEEPI